MVTYSWLHSWAFTVYLIAVPFVAAFALAPSLPLPLFAAILMAFLYLPKAKIRFDLFDPLFAVLFFLVLVPYIWSMPYVTVKALTHLIALVTVFTVFFFIPRHILSVQFCVRGGFERFCRLYASVLFFVSLFLILEFIGNNVFGFYLNDFIPYPARQEYQATITSSILRSRGLASESGQMALFFDLGLFLSIPGMRGRFQQYFFWPVVLFGFVTMFSVASFFLVTVAATYYILRLSRSRPVVLLRAVVVVVLLVSVAFFFWGGALEEYFIRSFFPKISFLWLDANVGSGASRMSAFTEATTLISHYPFGIGFGIAPAAAELSGNYFGFPISAGHISLFSLFLVAGGIPAATIFMVIHFGFMLRAMRLRYYSRYVSAGGLALSLHFLMIGDFYLPFLWLFWAIVIALQVSERRQCGKYKVSW